ncbi:MAG: hypothetical protein DRP56_01645 [Planctomycetota bacterium]|nr:MAG: hypothetical protein DRP56_01645 [Planctomycetota bacterium]
MSYYWRPYVSVAQQRAKAMKKIEKLRKQGKDIQPIEIEGRTIARSFWGKAWCEHLESFSDFKNRLPRGRRYVRNGSVCHLEIKKGQIEAIVSGSEVYKVAVDIKPLKSPLWKSIKRLCSGQISSMLELLQGRLSDSVMSIVTDRDKGLMPLPKEISLKCSCPDWAVMCKHVAAAMYGIGSRLDSRPELLFTLRGVNADELITDGIALPKLEPIAAGNVIADDQISDIFGIEMASQTIAEQEDSTTARAKKINKGRKRKIVRKNSTRDRVAKTVKSYKTQKKTKKTAKKVSKSIIKKQKPRKLKTSKLPRLRPSGNSVKKLRKKLGFSVPQFAEQLGVSSAIVYRWEKTRGRLSLQKRSLTALSRLHRKVMSKPA